MIIAGSGNGRLGAQRGWEILESGGSALDAVEAACRVVESDPDDHTVGYGGYPNVLGDVELDASIMDGATRRAGAVGALRGFRHPITVARAVMERLPHVLVVGDGAARLAEELGMSPEDLLTDPARQVWQDGLDALDGLVPPGSTESQLLSQVTRLVADPDHAAGTVNFLARDRAGHLAVGVSTSGWAWKHPGRLGDSPVIGAGNYADDRYGAAACTGFGELTIRAGTTRMVVSALGGGAGLLEACTAAVHDIIELATGSSPTVHLVALDRDGGVEAVSTRPGQTYVVRDESMTGTEVRPRRVVSGP